MKVYLDLVVLINFLVDFLLMMGSSKLSGFLPNGKRVALSSGLGAVYAMLCCLPGLGWLSGGFWYLLIFAAMCVIAYGWRTSTIRQGVLFFLLSMALGGIATGMGGRTIWALVLSAAGLWLLCVAGLGGGNVGSQFVNVMISHGGKTVRVTALLDTGNTLKDPVTGLAVMVADSAAAKLLLNLTRQELEEPVETLQKGKHALRLVPYTAVGQSGGFLLAIRPQGLEIDGKKKNMLVAFAPQDIGAGKRFQALVGGMV